MDDKRWNRSGYGILEPKAEITRMLWGMQGIAGVSAVLVCVGLGLAAVWFFGAALALAAKAAVILACLATGLAGPWLLRKTWWLLQRYAPPAPVAPQPKAAERTWVDGDKIKPALEDIARQLERVPALPEPTRDRLWRVVESLFPKHSTPLGGPRRPALPAPSQRVLPPGTVEAEVRELEHSVPRVVSRLSDPDTYHVLLYCYRHGRYFRARYWLKRRLPSGTIIERTEWNDLRSRILEAGLLEPFIVGSSRPRRLRGHLGEALAALRVVQPCSCASCAAARTGGRNGEIPVQQGSGK